MADKTSFQRLRNLNMNFWRKLRSKCSRVFIQPWKNFLSRTHTHTYQYTQKTTDTFPSTQVRTCVYQRIL